MAHPLKNSGGCTFEYYPPLLFFTMHHIWQTLTTKCGAKSSEIKEINEFREKITKFPNFTNLLKFFIRGKTSFVYLFGFRENHRRWYKRKERLLAKLA